MKYKKSISAFFRDAFVFFLLSFFSREALIFFLSLPDNYLASAAQKIYIWIDAINEFSET